MIKLNDQDIILKTGYVKEASEKSECREAERGGEKREP